MAGHPIPLATIRAATDVPEPELAMAEPMDCTASDRFATFIAFMAD
jgi:hypothetical protein